MAESENNRKCPGDLRAIRKQMLSEKKAKAAVQRMKLLAHPTRLQILKILAKEDQCVCVFAQAIGKKQPNISQHLARLKDNGIIDSYMKGKYVYYTLEDKEIKKLLVILWDG